MTYRILRNELSKNWKGQDRYFLHIEVNTGTEVFAKAEWLSPTELAQVMANPANLDGIAAAMAARAVIARPQVKLDEQRAHEIIIENIKLETAKAVMAAQKL